MSQHIAKLLRDTHLSLPESQASLGDEQRKLVQAMSIDSQVPKHVLAALSKRRGGDYLLDHGVSVCRGGWVLSQVIKGLNAGMNRIYAACRYEDEGKPSKVRFAEQLSWGDARVRWYRVPSVGFCV